MTSSSMIGQSIDWDVNDILSYDSAQMNILWNQQKGFKFAFIYDFQFSPYFKKLFINKDTGLERFSYTNELSDNSLDSNNKWGEYDCIIYLIRSNSNTILTLCNHIKSCQKNGTETLIIIVCLYF